MSKRTSGHRSPSSERESRRDGGTALPSTLGARDFGAIPRSIISAADCLAVQRAAGNSATQHLLSRKRSSSQPRAVLQRVATAYTFADLGYGHNDPNPHAAAHWLYQTIAHVNYDRLGIDASTKAAVRAFGDGDAGGMYRHYVPSVWISTAIVKAITNPTYNVTRDQSITWLKLRLEGFGIADTSNLDPRTNVAAFNAWFSWVIDAIADWPNNIYRWSPSTGDAVGRQVDTPQNKPAGAVVPAALMARLAEAKTTLENELGVSRPPEWNVA